MNSRRDYYFPNTEELAAGRDAHHCARHRPALRAPCTGQLLLVDRTRQWRQIHLGFRVRLAGEFHRARNSRIRTSPPFSRPICMPTMLAILPRSGSEAGPAVARNRSWFMDRRGRSRNTASSISSRSRSNPSPGTPIPGSGFCPMPAPRSKCMNSTSAKSASSTTRTASSSKAFRRSISMTAR